MIKWKLVPYIKETKNQDQFHSMHDYIRATMQIEVLELEILIANKITQGRFYFLVTLLR